MLAHHGCDPLARVDSAMEDDGGFPLARLAPEVDSGNVPSVQGLSR